jgi:hypothetical protein
VHIEYSQLAVGHVPKGVDDSGRDSDPGPGAGPEYLVPQHELGFPFEDENESTWS